LCLSAAALCFWPAAGHAAGRTVNVTLPSFGVTLNGRVINNAYRKYPLIVYKDITYFPMTYADCRFLGVETEWDGNALYVETTGKPGEFAEERSKTANRSAYTASAADLPIYVNGRLYAQDESAWPFLSFRDITYFPLIWQYTYTEFRWANSFGAASGLVIDSGAQWESGILSIDLPLKMWGDSFGACAFAGDTVYYEGRDGKIYSAPLNAPRKAKAVYDLPIDPASVDGASFARPELRTEDGKVFLAYHAGGATMGADYSFLLGPDGVIETLPGSAARAVGGRLIAVQHFGMPFTANLWARADGEDAFRQVGDPDLYYAFSDGIAVRGDELFIVAKYYADGVWANDAYVYRVNLNTGATARVTDKPQGEQRRFYIGDDDAVYYLDEDHLIRRQSLADGPAKTVLAEAVSDFALTSEDLYYVPKSQGMPYRLSDRRPLTELPEPAGYAPANAPGDAELQVWNDVLRATLVVPATPESYAAHVLQGRQMFSQWTSPGTSLTCTDGARLLLINVIE
jgi:hypothetical protein